MTDSFVSDTSMKRPHVVILGAGASVAALPNGDREGRKLPVMNNLVDVVGLRSTLGRTGVRGPVTDFEGLFSDLHESAAGRRVVAEIERALVDYFSSLLLPDEATLYDYLVLSLRGKDVVATFNWDPFLWQAAVRNHRFGEMPRLVFLHGSVAVGYCLKDRRIGHAAAACPICGEPLVSPPLLYPIREKRYNCNPLIAGEWARLQSALKAAYILTVFGYSAPAADVEAVSLMKVAWGRPQSRELEETEIVDIRLEEDLLATWAPFICEHHYQIHSDYWSSWVARHPRRSCEAMWALDFDTWGPGLGVSSKQAQ